MTLYTLLLVVIVILLFYIKKKISDVTQQVEDKIHEAKALITNPQAIVNTVGGAVVDTALHQAAKFIQSKKDKKKKD